MRQTVLPALMALAGLLLCACAAQPPEPIEIQAAGQSALLPYVETEAPPTPGRNDGFAPLSIIRGVESCGEGYIVYPKVLYCDHAEAINRSIYEVTAARAKEASPSVFTKYRVEYNRNGLFSLRMELYDLYGDGSECLESVYLTYDVQTGRLCTLADLLDQADDRWRGIMPDIITAQAEARGITLLCDVMPISDGQQFYITQDEVVLVYELYEIATWAAGEPEFAIPIVQLNEFIPQGSPLKKVALDGQAPPPALAVDSAFPAEENAEPEAPPTDAYMVATEGTVRKDGMEAAGEGAP